MLRLDPSVVRAIDPRLQIRKDKMDHRQMLFYFLGVAPKRKRVVPVAHFAQVAIPAPAVGMDDRTSRYVLFDECRERVCVATGTNDLSGTGDNAEAQTASIDKFLGGDAAFVSVLPFRAAILSILARSDFNSANDGRLMVDSSPFASGSSTNAAFVDLNGMGRTDGIAVWPHHTGAQLVKHGERRFIRSDPKLALKLDGGLSGCLRRHEVSTPKPSRERHMTRLHNRSGSERCIFLAGAAAQYDRRAGCKTVWLSGKSALLARKAIWPANRLQITRAGVAIREEALELRKARWEGRIHA